MSQPRHAFLSLLIYVLALSLVSLLSACTPARNDAQARRYELKGTIVSFDKGQQQVVITHEDVPGLMEGMTMGFTLREPTAYDVMRPGDHIQATLVVSGARSWLENPIITQVVAGADAVPAAASTVEPQPGAPVPDFTLTNQDGKRITLQKYRGRALLLTFIYTRCPLPDYCPRMSTNFAALDRALQHEPDLGSYAHLLSVTLDPAYDTPKVLRSYGAAYTENYTDEKFERWELATGQPEEIKRLAQFCGLTYVQQADQIVHSLRTVLISPDGKLVKIYRGNEWKPEDVLNDLRLLRDGKQVS
jgi:protein SCO1/2